MTTPLRIRCADAADMPSTRELARLADGEQHVVLELETVSSRLSKRPIVERLRAELPDHSVFDSGGDADSGWISIVRVVRQRDVVAHAPLLAAAVEDYLRLAAELLAAFRASQLGEGWTAHEHGEHVRLVHEHTKQVVEAPLAPTDADGVDPYFFWLFVSTTPRHAVVAALLPNGFHDAARALDILADRGSG